LADLPVKGEARLTRSAAACHAQRSTPQSDYAFLQCAYGIEEFSHRGIAGDRVNLRRIEYVLTTTSLW
jgi:hypothetical protein